MFYAVALTFAYAGDAKRAQELADSLSKVFPEDTIARFNYLPALRAKLALLHTNPQEALHFLEAAAPYELGLPSNSFYNWPNLYPIYVRGEAFLAAQQGREAAREFQRILDHRAIVLNEPIGALAHLQLGRAYALQGDAAMARAAYQDFLRLWKDADSDSDIPILREASAEYAPRAVTSSEARPECLQCTSALTFFSSQEFKALDAWAWGIRRAGAPDPRW